MQQSPILKADATCSSPPSTKEEEEAEDAMEAEDEAADAAHPSSPRPLVLFQSSNRKGGRLERALKQLTQ